MFVITLLLTIVAALFHRFWLRNYSYWKRQGFPYLPGSFPFGTNHELTLFSKFQGTVAQDLYKQLAPHPYGGFYIWNRPVLLVRDPEIIRTIMTKEFSHFRDRGRVQTSSRVPLTEHLFDLDGERWRPVRVKLTPTFTSGRIKNMFTLFEPCAEHLENEIKRRIDQNQSINIKDLTTCFTLDTITSCAFGLDTNSAENEYFRKASQTIFKQYVTLTVKTIFAIWYIFPVLSKVYKLTHIEGKILNFFSNLVSNTVKYREKNNIRRNDFLDLLLQLKNKGVLENEKKENNTEMESSAITHEKGNAIEMTEGLLAAQCFVFFAAGFETSASVQSYALYELALNQDVQDKVLHEIDELIKRNGTATATYDSLQELHYTEQVISEAMRKYPTIPVITRKCIKSCRLPDRPELTIEKDTQIIIPIYALHHNPEYFPEPEKFDPERFSPENKSSIQPYTYLPFGEGPRHCIGKRFGLLQTKMGLYTVLKNYRVLVCDDTPIPLKFSPSTIISATSGPIKLQLQFRKDKSTI